MIIDILFFSETKPTKTQTKDGFRFRKKREARLSVLSTQRVSLHRRRRREARRRRRRRRRRGEKRREEKRREEKGKNRISSFPLSRRKGGRSGPKRGRRRIFESSSFRRSKKKSLRGPRTLRGRVEIRTRHKRFATC